MKQLNIAYEDKEFELLEEAKNITGKNWHDTMLEWAKLIIDSKR